MQAWTDSAWLDGAKRWIRSHLALLGIEEAGEIEQPHVRPWSTVLRVPTIGGNVWFKANIECLAHEAAVVRLIALRRPDLVPGLLAVDTERGWMLMEDGGERLREIVERERSFDRWRSVLPLYASLQLDLADEADALVAAGAPDLRLPNLPRAYEELLDSVPGLASEDRARLAGLTAHVTEMSHALAAHGIPETIQHDDLHDGQVFVRDGRHLFFDWGDACVSHPFFSLSVTLEGVLSWGLDDIEDSEDTTPYRDAYLQNFAQYGSANELVSAVEIALRLGWVCRAVNSAFLAEALEPPTREEHFADVAVRLKMFADKLER